MAKPLRVAAGTRFLVPWFSGARSPLPDSEPHDAELSSAVNTTSGQPEPARLNSSILVRKELEPFASPSYVTILIFWPVAFS